MTKEEYLEKLNDCTQEVINYLHGKDLTKRDSCFVLQMALDYTNYTIVKTPIK